MSTLPATLRFDEARAFYPMVATFLAASAALPLVIDPKERAALTPQDAIGLESHVHPKLVIRRLALAEEIDAKRITGNQIFSLLCCMLINTAYEAVKDHNSHTPEWEFFRHVRNAASHGNAFFFTPQEPKRPASWRGLAVGHAIKGAAHPLFRKPCFNSFLWEGDVLVLLADIEATLP